MKKILIMGLPGAGKTTLAEALINQLLRESRSVFWLNADDVRRSYNDWDFSEEGRIRQSERMRDFANERSEEFVICDFVAPLPKMREIVDPDYLIWVDTITEGRYQDTNKIFIFPEAVDLHVDSKNAEYWASVIFNLVA